MLLFVCACADFKSSSAFLSHVRVDAFNAMHDRVACKKIINNRLHSVVTDTIKPLEEEDDFAIGKRSRQIFRFNPHLYLCRWWGVLELPPWVAVILFFHFTFRILSNVNEILWFCSASSFLFENELVVFILVFYKLSLGDALTCLRLTERWVERARALLPEIYCARRQKTRRPTAADWRTVRLFSFLFLGSTVLTWQSSSPLSLSVSCSPRPPSAASNTFFSSLAISSRSNETLKKMTRENL